VSRFNARALVLAAVLVAAAAAIAFTRPQGADYANFDCQLRQPCEDAQPVIDDLISGNFAALWREQGLLGPVSLVWRAPFAALASGTEARYRLGCFACLLVLAAAALLIASEMRRRGKRDWQIALVALFMVVNPMVFKALDFGHPEEALGAALMVIAAVLAIRGRAVAAAVAAALLLANKLWGVLALVPLGLALPRSAWRQAAVAFVLVLALVYGPVAVGAPDHFHDAVTSASKLGAVGGTASKTNAWFFLMKPAPFSRITAIKGGSPVYEHALGLVLPSPWVKIAHPLVILLAVAMGVLWWRARAPDPADLLLLLAAIFLLRCILEPGNHSYYHLPFLICLIAFEGLAWGFPLLAIVSAGALQLLASASLQVHASGSFVWLYLGWSVSTFVGLALILWLRSRSTRLTPPSPTRRRPVMASSRA
jgi:hypothetical protein